MIQNMITGRRTSPPPPPKKDKCILKWAPLIFFIYLVTVIDIVNIRHSTSSDVEGEVWCPATASPPPQTGLSGCGGGPNNETLRREQAQSLLWVAPLHHLVPNQQASLLYALAQYWSRTSQRLLCSLHHCPSWWLQPCRLSWILDGSRGSWIPKLS